MGNARVIQDLDPPKWTTTGVAKLVGRSPGTIERWRRDGVYVPRGSIQLGGVLIHLYDAADIKNLTQISEQRRAGRKANPEQE